MDDSGEHDCAFSVATATTTTTTTTAATATADRCINRPLINAYYDNERESVYCGHVYVASQFRRSVSVT